MQNDQVRNDFIRCFTPYKDVVSSELYSNTLRPMRAYNNFLNFLKNPSFEKLVNKTDEARLCFPKCKCEEGPALTSFATDLNMARSFFRTLKVDYENIKKLKLVDKAGNCAVIAKLPNGDFVLVEVLVEEEKTPDARFLSYLCTLQGPQIRVGESWKNLLSVVGVNILGTGMQDVAMGEKSAQYKRHYQVTDRLDTCDSPRMFPQIQLIQYSLGNLPAIDEIPDPSERYWMRFFSNAHSEENIPAGSPPVIAKAYDIIRPKHLPDSVKSALVAEEKLFLNREDAYMERGRAQKRAETVSLLRKGGKADQDTIGRLLRKRASSEGDTPANRNADAAPTLRRRRRREPRKPEAGGDSGGAEPAAAPEAPTSTRRRRHHLRQGAGGGGSLAV